MGKETVLLLHHECPRALVLSRNRCVLQQVSVICSAWQRPHYFPICRLSHHILILKTWNVNWTRLHFSLYSSRFMWINFLPTFPKASGFSIHASGPPWGNETHKPRSFDHMVFYMQRGKSICFMYLSCFIYIIWSFSVFKVGGCFSKMVVKSTFLG